MWQIIGLVTHIGPTVTVTFIGALVILQMGFTIFTLISKQMVLKSWLFMNIIRSKFHEFSKKLKSRQIKVYFAKWETSNGNSHCSLPMEILQIPKILKFQNFNNIGGLLLIRK